MATKFAFAKAIDALSLDVIKLLIASEANVDHEFERRLDSKLFYATCYGHIELMRVLIEAGVDIEKRNS